MSEEVLPEPPLAGIKVLDLTAIVLGPLATLCLADLGAEVVKLEPPEGDGIRNAGVARGPGMGSIFLALNRNKRSLALDLKRPEAKPVLERLANWADVLVHNMRPDAARGLGLDYASLSAVNPRLIYCSASGFAASGKRADDPAVDDVIQAASGLASLFAANGEEPRFVPSLIADKVTGLVLCQAVLAALLSRERTGRGQVLNVSMSETMSAFTLIEHLAGAAFVPPVGPTGYGRLTTPHRRPMKTADGHVAMTPYSKRHWQAFFKAAGRADLADDPRVTDPALRNSRVAELYALLGSLLVTKTSQEWMELARTEGIPVSAVNSLDDLVKDGGLRETGVLKQQEHPSEGSILAVAPVVGLPYRAAAATPAPRLGEHSLEILSELGVDPDTCAELHGAGIVTVSR